MNKYAAIGFGWFSICYLVAFVIYARAEHSLDEATKTFLAKLRRPLRIVPVAFTAGIFVTIALQPSYLWLYLMMAGTPIIVVANWYFRSKNLPKAYIASFLFGSVSLWIGVMGLATILGYASKYVL